MTQHLLQKRLGKKDMHTLYDSALKNLERLSNKELSNIIKDEDVSEELRDKANAILWKRLDPQDRDTVEL